MVSMDISIRIRIAVMAYCLAVAVCCYLPTFSLNRWWKRHSLLVSLLAGIPVSIIVFFVTG